ncbi:F-type H+-transporting ATPase subunit gamma [Marinobacter antarcticus]|uniref:F-type H+-transporting ATPase subunit gamma n=1 Tax=Marinobacter antarcticus TaxID=564117 RepID=A0A1M6PLU3_9GAMM|nr:F0F1 ATP synthase subunit gamma [Marinobacter antarcticus]SHK08919.1 F-type H+-transporting ATPase subunit gamma [Marinobacter antarcticus]
MAQTLETLSRHSDTLKSIRGIVHTMKTLSAINASPYEHAARSIEAYHQTILQGFAAFAYRTGEIALRRDGALEHLVIVFGSDHGLCGNYNEILADLVKQHCQTQIIGKRCLLCIGAQMNDALDDQGLTPDAVLLPPASADGIGRLAGDIVTRIDRFSQGQPLAHLAVTLAFTQRGEQGLREPVTRRLLPLNPALLQREKYWNSCSLPDYTMPADALLSSLIRSHIFASVFRASAEAMVTENSARLALMQQAEQSVDERIEQVLGELRSVRQTEITNELMDLIIGFEALKKRGKRKGEQAQRT